jgi:hypothetical protein
MEYNFVPSDDIAYITYRQFNDLREDIYRQQAKLISIFGLTTIVTGNKAARYELILLVYKGITHSNKFSRTTLTYLARRCQREASNCGNKIQRKFLIVKSISKH